MTVNELEELCKKAIAEGYGDSVIILSNNVSQDPEDFCSLEKGFSSPVYNSNGLHEYLEDNNIDENNIIVLN